MNKYVKQYADEDIISEFYKAVLDNNPSAVYEYIFLRVMYSMFVLL